MSVSVKIDGKKSKKQEVEDRVEQETLLEQAALMDTQATPPVEVIPPDRDVAQQPTVKRILEAEEVNDLEIPQQVSATVPKAKRARTQSTTKRMTEAVPKDEWNSFLEQYLERQKLLNNALIDMQRDLTKFRGESAPAQAQHVVPAQPSFYKPDVVQPEEVALRPNPVAREQVVDPVIPLGDPNYRIHSQDLRREMQRDHRMKKGIEDAPIHFENRAVRDRAMQYLSGNGATPSERDAHVAGTLAYWNGF